MLIAVVTPLFPAAGQPHRGFPVFNTVERLRDHADVQVICPKRVYPMAWSKHSATISPAGAPDPAAVTRPIYFEYPAIPLLTRPWDAGACARRLYRYLAKLRPDVVLSYWLHPEGTACVQVARALGLPVIVGARGSDLSRIGDGFLRRTVAKTLQGADYVLTATCDLHEKALLLGVPAEKCAAIPDACETSALHLRDRGGWDRERIASAYPRSWAMVANETYEKCVQVSRPFTKTKPRAFRGRPLRITLVTSYFPTSTEPHKGHSAFRTFQHLCNLADVKAIVPLPAYPSMRALFEPARLDSNYRPAGIETTYFHYPAIPLLTRPSNGSSCMRRLLPLLRATCPDVIMNYWLYPDGYAAVGAGAILGVPVIAGSIGSDLCRITDPITRRNVSRTLTRASRVITVSEDLRRRAIQMGAPSDSVTTVLNGCDTAIFHPGGREEARREVGWPEPGRLILYVGSLLSTKGLQELLEAFAGLLRVAPDARLAVIGDGGYQAALERGAAAGGVRDQIRMLGRMPSEQVAPWMRAADLLCLPSYSEGCPNVIVEAMSCGCPIVATNVGGIPELCDRRSSILVPPRDAEALRAALEKSLARTWDRAAIAGIFQRGWEQVARETFEVCRQAVESARAARFESEPFG